MASMLPAPICTLDFLRRHRSSEISPWTRQIDFREAPKSEQERQLIKMKLLHLSNLCPILPSSQVRLQSVTSLQRGGQAQPRMMVRGPGLSLVNTSQVL